MKFQSENKVAIAFLLAKFRGSALINQINQRTILRSGQNSSCNSLVITWIAVENTR